MTVEATCADYDGALTYQWYYCGTRNNKANATAIEGATSNSCTVKPATAKESHYYFCRVTAGEVVGDSVVAGVYASDPYVYINNTEKIYATCYAVTGKLYTMKITNTTNNVVSGELCYQWYRCTDSEGTGAEAIEGATTDSFDVPTGTKGTYYYFGKAYIKLNGSEICSDQTQVAKVIVRDAHKITPVGTPGEDGYTIVEGGKFYFTSVNNHLQDDFTCPKDETCRINYEPDNGYVVDKILVYKTGEPEVTVELKEWDSDTKQFTMPDFDITVEVTFKKPQPIENVDITVDWSRVPSVNVGDNVLGVRFNEDYDWAVFVDGAGAVNGPVEMTIFTVKVTDSNKKEICDAIVATGFNGLTPDDLTDMLEMLGCGAWLHPEFLFGINGYVVKENDVLAIMPFVNPYSGYFPIVGDAEIGGVYNGTVTCNGETVSDNAVFAQYGMSMLFPFIEVGTVSDLAEKKNAAETDVFDVFYNDDYGYTTGGSYGVMPGIVKAGETVTIRVNPDEGYEVDTVTWQPFVMPSDEGDDVNVVTLVDGKYTFTVPVDNAQDIMVKVTFKATATEPDDDDGPYVITLDTTGVINGAAGVLFYNADNTEGEDDYYLMPSPGETDSIELEFNTDSADVVVAAGEGYAFETPPVVTLATGDNTTTLNGEFEGGIYFYKIAVFTGDSTITVVGEAVAVGGGEGGDEGETIENLGEASFSVDEEGNVTFNTPTDDGYIYYTIVLPAAALEGSGITAEQYVEYYMEGTKHPVIDVTDSSVFDLSNMEAVAALTHSGTGQVYVTNAAVDGTNYPWTISSDSIIAVMKLKADNMVSGAYGNSYFPGLGFADVYAYGIHGVYAEIVEFEGSGGEGGDIVEGNVADISDWVSRSGDTVTINVPDGEKYMLGIIKHAEDEWNNAEYCEEVFGSFIGKTILTPENFEDQMYNYGNECYVELDSSGYFRELFTYVDIEEILTGNGEPIVLQLTEDQSIFLFHVGSEPIFQAMGGYKVYAILGAHAAEYLCDSNVPSDPAIDISDDLGLTVVGNTYTVDAGEYQLADGHSWAYVIDGADPLSDYLWSPSGIGEVPSGTYDASSWNKLDANNSCTYENATQWDVILCCDVDENGRVVAWAWLPLADAEPGEPEQPTAEFDSVEVSFTHANSIGAIVPGEALPDLSSLASSVVVKDTNGNILPLNNEDGVQLGWLCKNPDSDEGWVWANDIAEEGVVYGIRVYVQNDGSYTFNDATTDDITLSDNNLTVDSAWTNSDPAFEFGFILTVPAHEHSYTYTSNNNGTHNGACECGEDAIVNEACTYVSGKCEKCGYSKPVTPPVLPPVHTHSYTYTSNDNGTHNGACVCGEDAIVNEACTYVGGKCEKCEYSEPVTPPTPPTVNVPVSNNENKVDVEAEISGNDATIKPLDEEQIDKLVGSENASGDVVIDLSKLDENIDTAGIPKATLEAIVNAAEDAGNNTEYLVIILSTAELKFDDTAMRAIVEQANGDVLKFNFDDVGFDRLNATQKDAIKDMDVRKGYEAYITVNDQRIGDFKGGEVEIIVPYAVPEGEDVASFSVWYVDDDGTLEKQQSTYDGKEKCFIVTHFSDYVIVYSAEEVHNFAGDWKQDANEHWNECECGEDANRAAHADENNDGKCDVCDYQMATIIPEDTDDETSENLETSDTTNSDNDSTSDTEGGCRGGISIILIIVIILICVVIYIIFKKRDQDKNKAEKAK